MIKADKGYTLLEGRVVDLMQEFTHIVGDLLESSPEVVCATFSVYGLELSQEVLRCDTHILEIAEKIIREVKESRNNEKH